MGTVFKKQVTRPLPSGAEIIVRKGERLARWKDRKGKTRTATLTTGKDGADRIVTESPFYVAKYRDGSGVVRVEPTGCRDETAARQVLADLERKAELVRSGVMTAAEATIGNHQTVPLAEHFDAFDEHHQAKGVTKIHREDTGRYLRRLAAECSFGTLSDLRREALERWLAVHTAEGMSARSRNAYRNALVSFCNWCVETSRLAMNPFEAVPKANEKADPRRQRRAMTENELVKLLAVARERPLLEALTVRKGPRKGERYADVRPEVRERLELAREGTGLDLQDAAADRASQGRTGFPDRGAAAPRRPGSVRLPSTPRTKRTAKGTTSPCGMTLPRTCATGSPTSCAGCRRKPCRSGAPIPARLPPDTPVVQRARPRW